MDTIRRAKKGKNRTKSEDFIIAFFSAERYTKVVRRLIGLRLEMAYGKTDRYGAAVGLTGGRLVYGLCGGRGADAQIRIHWQSLCQNRAGSEENRLWKSGTQHKRINEEGAAEDISVSFVEVTPQSIFDYGY